jgi:hypothetical protein
MGKRRLVTAFAVAAVLLVPASAFAFGPAPPPGNPDNTAQLEACGNAVDRQIEAEIQAGGGPKSVDVGPANCDHFWQRTGRIGNGWPPKP